MTRLGRLQSAAASIVTQVDRALVVQSREIIFHNASVFDGCSEELQAPRTVAVSSGKIVRITAEPVAEIGDPRLVDASGCTLMPGLIDAHVHVNAVTLNLGQAIQMPQSYLAHHAACKARDKKGPFLGLKKGQLVQTKSLVRGMVVIGVGEAAVA